MIMLDLSAFDIFASVSYMDVVIVIVGLLSILLVWFLLNRLSKIVKKQLPKANVNTISGIILTVWTVLVAIGLLEHFQLNSAFSTLTLSSIIGLAITLALQSTLTNILSGFFLIQENILRIGDIITYGGIKGEVVKISYRTVWIKSNNGEIAILSNSTLSAGPFINHTATERLSKNLPLAQKLEKKIQETATKIPHFKD
jgi:small conductance mechanosensitive channel